MKNVCLFWLSSLAVSFRQNQSKRNLTFLFYLQKSKREGDNNKFFSTKIVTESSSSFNFSLETLGSCLFCCFLFSLRFVRSKFAFVVEPVCWPCQPMSAMSVSVFLRICHVSIPAALRPAPAFLVVLTLAVSEAFFGKLHGSNTTANFRFWFARCAMKSWLAKFWVCVGFAI